MGDFPFCLNPHSMKQVHGFVDPREIPHWGFVGVHLYVLQLQYPEDLLLPRRWQRRIRDNSPRLDNGITSGQLLFLIFLCFYVLSCRLCPMLCLRSTTISGHIDTTSVRSGKRMRTKSSGFQKFLEAPNPTHIDLEQFGIVGGDRVP